MLNPTDRWSPAINNFFADLKRFQSLYLIKKRTNFKFNAVTNFSETLSFPPAANYLKKNLNFRYLLHFPSKCIIVLSSFIIITLQLKYCFGVKSFINTLETERAKKFRINGQENLAINFIIKSIIKIGVN